jgi:hypothetical protein
MSKVLIGRYRTIGGTGYLTVNNQGTLRKMGKIRWYYVLILEVWQCLRGSVPYNTVADFVFLSSKRKEK